MKVLVTGAAGAVGRAVCAELGQRGHAVRGLDRSGDRPEGAAEMRHGDIADATVIDRAVAGVDAVVHLAAWRDDADFLTCLLQPNIVAVHLLYEAAVRHGVKRVINASSCQAVSGHQRSELIRIEDGPAPTNHYAVTKVFAEAMGDMYWRRHGITGASVRIGWLPRDGKGTQRIAHSRGGPDAYLSAGDAGRFFTLAVESQQLQYAVLFATSRPVHEAKYDLTPAERLLGYQPLDQFPQGAPTD